MSVTTLKIKSIRKNGGTQPRAELNKDTLKDYKESWLNSAEFPPITVWYDGENYWLSDGFHRLESAKMAGLKEIRAEVRQGTQRDAILESVGVNAEHGLRRSNADKHRAVETLLNDSEWEKWSDREIARRTKTSAPFVSKIRSEVTVNIYSEPRTYTTKHGTKATMSTKNIGKSTGKAKRKYADYTDEELRDLWREHRKHDQNYEHYTEVNRRHSIEHPYLSIDLMYRPFYDKNGDRQLKLRIVPVWATQRNVKEWEPQTEWDELDEEYYLRIAEPELNEQQAIEEQDKIELKYTFKLWRDGWFDYREKNPKNRPEWWREECEERLYKTYRKKADKVEKNWDYKEDEEYWERSQEDIDDDFYYVEDDKDSLEPDYVVRWLKRESETYFERLESISAKHQVSNEMIKYYRGLSGEYNRQSIKN